MGSNQGKLDGIYVENYDARFGGTFEMDEEIGRSVSYDDTKSFLVVATAGKVAFGANKDGELKRTTTFEVDSVTIVSPELAIKLANGENLLIDGVNAGQLTIDGPDVTAEFDEDDFVSAPASKGTNDNALSSFLDEDF